MQGTPENWVVNGNGCGRVNGTAYDQQMRWNIIRLYTTHFMGQQPVDWQRLSEMAGPSAKLCREWVQKYEAGESLDPKPHVSNPRTIVGEPEIMGLYNPYCENPSYELQDYVDGMLLHHNLLLSQATCSKVLLHDLELSFKVTSVCRAEKFTEENVAYSKEYWQALCGVDPRRIFFHDEMAVVAKDHE